MKTILRTVIGVIKATDKSRISIVPVVKVTKKARIIAMTKTQSKPTAVLMLTLNGSLVVDFNCISFSFQFGKVLYSNKLK